MAAAFLRSETIQNFIYIQYILLGKYVTIEYYYYYYYYYYDYIFYKWNTCL